LIKKTSHTRKPSVEKTGGFFLLFKPPKIIITTSIHYIKSTNYYIDYEINIKKSIATKLF